MNGNTQAGSRPIHSSQFTAHPAVGILGGTFDPIHFGHLRMAEELAEALGLGTVRFIPAGQPPHRNAPRTSASHRLEMVRLATASNPRFSVDAREVWQSRASYTVDTLTDLRNEQGDQQALWLLLGADSFLGLTSWKNWRQLFALANIAVAHRPGYDLTHADALDDELRLALMQRQCQAAPDSQAAGQIALCAITPLAVAATDLRNRLQSGRSVRYLTPDSVADYIEQHHLYLTA